MYNYAEICLRSIFDTSIWSKGHSVKEPKSVI